MKTGGERWRAAIATGNLGAWALVVAWTLIVLVLLTEPHLDDEGRQRLRFGIFELGHAAFFSVLGFLLSHALIRLRLPRFVWWTVVTLTLYGIVGELLQATVPGRSPSITDIAADAFGAFAGAEALTVIARWASGTRLVRALRIWPHRRPPRPDHVIPDQATLSTAEHRWNAD